MLPTGNQAAFVRMQSRLTRVSFPGADVPPQGPFPPARGINYGSYGGPSSARPYGEYGSLISVVTPSDLKARADQIDAYIRGLNEDMVAAPSIDPNVANQFAQFSTAWQDYYSSLTGVTGWVKRLWGSGTSDALDQFQQGAQDWKNKLGSSGVSVTAPDMPPPPDNSGASSTIRTVAIAGAVIVGGIVLLKALDFLPHGVGSRAMASFGGGSAPARGYGRRARGKHYGILGMSPEANTVLYAGMLGIGLYILYRGTKG